MDIVTYLPILALLLLIGAVAGVLAGLLGVGGGIVLVPAFFYLFSSLGYSGDSLMQVCLATSLATIIVTSARSVMSHHKKGAVDWDILRSWAPGIVIGAVLGVFVANRLESNVLTLLFGVLGICIGLYMGFGKNDLKLSEEMPKGAKLALFSPPVGFLSVLMGIGGGSFGVPLMTLHGRPIHRAVATAAGFGVIIAVPSVIGFLITKPTGTNLPPFTIGYVNWLAFLIIIAMTIFTAPLGAKLAHILNPKTLKRVFAVFLILVASNMLWSAWSAL